MDRATLEKAATDLHHNLGHSKESYFSIARKYFGTDNVAVRRSLNDTVVRLFGHDYRMHQD